MHSLSPRTRLSLLLGAVALGSLTLAVPSRAQYAEEPACRSTNPADWPASSKPYFLLAVDTSLSMFFTEGTSTPPTEASAGFPVGDSDVWANSCAYVSDPDGTGPIPPRPNRNDAARCAIYNAVQAYGGLVNLGLMTFASRIELSGTGSPTPSCNGMDATGSRIGQGCRARDLYNPSNTCSYGNGTTGTACCGGNLGGNECCVEDGNPAGTGVAPWGASYCTGTAGNLWDGSQGGNVLVGVQQDNYWDPLDLRAPSNVADLLKWVDNDCRGCEELWASGGTPLHGLLRDAQHYLEGGWSDGTRIFTSPLTGGERPCRSVNVILLTDGEEYCEGYDGSHYDAGATCASNAAAELLAGVTISDGEGSNVFPVRTHVIALGPAATGSDNIAYGGGTERAYVANNETELAAALANIISSAIPPESCNNVDDNCNGCTDEGFRVYCNRDKESVSLGELLLMTEPHLGQCCAWGEPLEREDCLAAFRTTVRVDNPQGDRWLLPCWEADTDTSAPETKWLCNDPQELCDELDNNCELEVLAAASGFASNVADEGYNKCPLCPTAEICNGQDDDCDGLIDNVAPPLDCGSCVPSAEICDGVDNDCDGLIDEALEPIACGLLFSDNPACQGVQVCEEQPNPSGLPGAGTPGSNQWSECSATPGGSDVTCDGIDDDCNGLIDDAAPPLPCEPSGTPGGLVYQDTFAASRCQMGTVACVDGGYAGACVGWVGPSDEICDAYDNDCDGAVNERPGAGLLPGEGIECGTAVGECEKGTTECVDERIQCTGGRGPGPERCDGLDSDCDGIPDSLDQLADAPANPNCWSVPGDGCSHGDPATTGLSWDPPLNADCQGLGALVTPCDTGTLHCNVDRWICQGGRLPAAEVCDGVDNDCNDTIDEGDLGAPIGLECGIDTGECTLGVNVCEAGLITCSGQGPVPELCDGLDNDCDGAIDNGIGLGGTCWPAHDTALYPGERTQGECRPGRLQCDPSSPTLFTCVGGVGPSPELCDGKDNDCDGDTDEAGPPPDGIDGTADPLDSSDEPRRLGDRCGVNEGLCLEGELVCIDGAVVCGGGVGPAPELCDCADNDCDGETDEPVVCSPGKTCVDAGTFCVCLDPCAGGEFPCPTGSTCESLPRSHDGVTGAYCLYDPCGDCRDETVRAGGEVVCAPTTEAATATVPECVCKGAAGCQSPCYQVACSATQACVLFGPNAGQCQPQSNCYFFGCEADAICRDGSCVDAPCAPNPCASDEVCRPDATGSGADCVPSCAEILCDAGERCVNGACVETGCAETCTGGEICRSDGDGGFACGPSLCAADSCPDGDWCDPATGDCSDEPCTGVVCPEGQRCRGGDCFAPESTQPGAGGQGGQATGTGGVTTTTGGSAGAPTSTTGGQAAPEPEPRGAWGLATGGGGCACRAAPGRSTALGAMLALLGALALERRRRRRPDRGSSQTAQDQTAGGAR